MAKGSVAKQNIAHKIMELYGNDYVGTENNKIYVYEDDGGERVQIAISFTCPKEGLAKKMPEEEAKNPNVRHMVFSKEEEQEVKELMARLGL